MTIFNFIRFSHLLLYFMVALQLVYYFYLMGDALHQVSIGSFLEERRIVHPMIMQRHQIVYHACLVASLLMLVLSWRRGSGLSITAYSIAFVCLVADILIAVKENGPINRQIQNSLSVVASADWETLRTEWIRLIKLRGAIISVGMVSLFAGLVFGR